MTMIQEKISVFFDTNSYRQIVLDKTETEIVSLFKELNVAEKRNNIEAISTFTVNLELMANLVEDENGLNHKNCLNSLQFLSNHCYDSEKDEIRICAIPFFQVSAMMFGALPIDFDKSSKKFSKLIESFKSFENKKPKISKEIYEFVKNNLQKHELGFATTLSELLSAANLAMKKIYPNLNSKTRRKKLIDHFKADSYAQHLALQTLKIISENLEIKLSDEELRNRAYFLRTELPISSGFFQWILCKMIEDNIDIFSKISKTKRWNWLWDYQISYVISNNTINKGKMLIITSDKEMIEVLKLNNLENKVMTISEYLKFLNINNGSC